MGVVLLTYSESRPASQNPVSVHSLSKPENAHTVHQGHRTLLREARMMGSLKVARRRLGQKHLAVYTCRPSRAMQNAPFLRTVQQPVLTFVVV